MPRRWFGCFGCLIVFEKRSRIITRQVNYVSWVSAGCAGWCAYGCHGGEGTPCRAGSPTRRCHPGVVSEESRVSDAPANETATYSYDQLGRLTGATGFSGGQTAAYAYDAIGNLIRKKEGPLDLTLAYPAPGAEAVPLPIPK